MIRQAFLTGAGQTDSAEVYMDNAARRGRYETGVRIWNNYTQTWLKINVTQTTSNEDARWHFLHLLDRLQRQGWTLVSGNIDTTASNQDDADYAGYLDQAIRLKTVGRG